MVIEFREGQQYYIKYMVSEVCHGAIIYLNKAVA